MNLTVAKALIEKGIQVNRFPQQWIDLGAGDGLFTLALSEILPPQSMILAVDKNHAALEQISISDNIKLELLAADFSGLPKMEPQDGILMANSLHYVSDQVGFLKHLRTNFLKKSGVVLLVEYDLTVGNAWVPYPIQKSKISELAMLSGFRAQEILHSVPSRLNASEIYSVVLKQ